MKKNLLRKSLAFMLALVGLLGTINVYAADVTAEQALIDVSITVVDQTDVPVIGATVILVENNAKAVSTDADGVAKMGNVPANGNLLIKYVGYSDKTVAIDGQKTIRVVLEEDAELIDEVVVVGFGTQKKTNLTGAVAILDGEALESRPVSNVQQALQGQIAGLNLTTSSSSSELGGSYSMNIRGSGTIGTGSSASPLVLIDGVEGDMNSLNANDIASFSVLKDASASAIYGSRAAFGVILITTKSGGSGKAVINYTGNVRFSSVTEIPSMVDSYTFATVFNEASLNYGSTAIFSDATMELIKQYQAGEITTGTQANATNTGWYSYDSANANTDWIGEQYRDFSPAHEHTLSVSGGTQDLNYRISASLLDQEGILNHGGDNFQRYTLNARIGAKIADWLRVDYSTRWTREDLDEPTYMNHSSSLFFHNITRRWPTIPVYDNNGYYMSDSEIIQLEDGGRSTDKQDYLTNMVTLTATPIEGWRIVAEGSYKTWSQITHAEYLPVYYHDPNENLVGFTWDAGVGSYPAGTSRVTEGNYNTDQFTVNLYTDYTKSFGDHNLKVMVGFNAEEWKYRSLWGSRYNLITSELPSLATATSDMSNSSYEYDWSNAGFFGRINYDYKEKYLLEIAARYDGSSRYIGDKRWGLFPSVSAGWNITREDFMESIGNTVSLLKLRASWGSLGNMSTSSYYPFYQTMTVYTDYGSWLIDGDNPNVAYQPGMVSDELTWETVETWDIGIDFGLFKNRLTGTFDYFQRSTLDMVGPSPDLPSTLGTSVPNINNCDLISKGFEFELGWRDQIGSDFSYGVKLVLSDAVQTVTSYPNETGDLSTYYNGYTIGEIWGYTTVGIAKSQEEMDAHIASASQSAFGSNWSEGDIMYADLNGDGAVNSGQYTLDDHGDLSIIGNSTARYNYGITLDAQYKGFDFSIFFQGTGKRDYWLSGASFFGISGGMWQSTVYDEHLDYYRPENTTSFLGANTDAYYPRVIMGDSKNQYTQTGYLQDASYCRIKNVQLGYTLPQSVMNAIGLTSIRVYLSADNLYTFTSLSSAFDPEALYGAWGDGKQYPLQQTLSAGINITF